MRKKFIDSIESSGKAYSYGYKSSFFFGYIHLDIRTSRRNERAMDVRMNTRTTFVDDDNDDVDDVDEETLLFSKTVFLSEHRWRY